MAAPQTATWLGGAGTWNITIVNNKWSTGVAPNNTASTTYSVNIDGGNGVASTINLYANTYFGPTGVSISDLTIDANDELVANYGTLRIIDSFSLQGTLSLGYQAQVVLPPNATVSGGTIRLKDEPASLSAESGALTLAPGVNVRADAPATYPASLATLGSLTTNLVNKAHLVSDRYGRGFAIAGGSIDNQGILEVANGGTIGINSTFTLDSIGTLVNKGGNFAILGTLDNTARTFRVDAQSGQWQLAGTIHGGAIETGDNLALSVPFSNGTLDNVRINGRVEVSGRLNVPPGQAFTGSGEIVISGAEAIEGDGTIAAQNGSTVIGPGLMIHGGDALLRFDPFPYPGHATVGDGFWGDLHNHGTIAVDARNDVGEGLAMQIDGKSIYNDGTLKVIGQSVMHAHGRLVFDGGGTLVIDGGGMLHVWGDLDLSSDQDFLDVLPLPGGAAYDNYLIADFPFSSLTGEFSHVTPGIAVQYLAHEIRISGTPVPEPAAVGLMMGLIGGLAWRRRRSCEALEVS